MGELAWQRRGSNMFLVKSVKFMKKFGGCLKVSFSKYNDDCTQVSGEREPSQWAYTLSNFPSLRSAKKNIDRSSAEPKIQKGQQNKTITKTSSHLVSFTLESAYGSNFGRRRVARPHFPFLFLTNPALNQSKCPQPIKMSLFDSKAVHNH